MDRKKAGTAVHLMRVGPCAFCAVAWLLLFGCSHDIQADRDALRTNLREAFENDDRAAMEKWLEAGADINDTSEDSLGLSILDEAVVMDNSPMVEFLLKHGAVPQKDGLGRNLLFYARDKDIARLLIKQGLSLDEADADGRLPLHAVCAGRKIDSELFKVILDDGKHVNAKDEKGRTPLYLVCMSSRGDSNLDCAELLIKSGADVNAGIENGWPPLAAAAVHPNAKILQMLIDHGAEIDFQDREGNGVLHTAFFFPGKEENVPILLKNGANPDLRNQKGQLYHETGSYRPPAFRGDAE